MQNRPQFYEYFYICARHTSTPASKRESGADANHRVVRSFRLSGFVELLSFRLGCRGAGRRRSTLPAYGGTWPGGGIYFWRHFLQNASYTETKRYRISRIRNCLFRLNWFEVWGSFSLQGLAQFVLIWSLVAREGTYFINSLKQVAG